MNITDFDTIKKLERHARVNGPLMELLNERWRASDEKDPAYIETLNRVQAISQEMLNLITTGLL